MKSHDTHTSNHQHIVISDNQMANERRTWLVIALTAAMMVLEIAAGFVFGSMALLADCLLFCPALCLRQTLFIWYRQNQ